ncbi:MULTISPECIES: hypothetical protein [Polymorphospora]|uniref:ABC transporter permease n=1 Tax=Polymorphospora lycopeni TaxID=3140240 RepID=A0ABV5CUJ5_9ACTN
MTRRQPPPVLLAVLIGVAVVALQALLVPLFAGPAANLQPRDLPIVVAGPPEATAAITARMEQALPGGFEIIARPDAAAADRALRDREAYGAVVVGPDGPVLHTASAASPAVATLLAQAAGQLGDGRPVPVVDVVPGDPDDPRGGGFAGGFLPLVMTSLIAAAALTLAVRSRPVRLAGLLTYGVLAGLAGAAVLQFWLGVLPGGYPLNAAVIGLTALAVAATVAGLGSLLGLPGIGLGALIVFLVGNALSAVGAAPELLPQPWGTVGQWLPVGAGGTLLRSAAFFDGAGGAQPAWILAGYVLVGLVLLLVGRAVPAVPGRSVDRPADPGDPVASGVPVVASGGPAVTRG